MASTIINWSLADFTCFALSCARLRVAGLVGSLELFDVDCVGLFLLLSRSSSWSCLLGLAQVPFSHEGVSLLGGVQVFGIIVT